MLNVLRRDPSSRTAAAIEGWDYPLDRAGWMLADLIDIQGRKAFGRAWKPYPRPAKVNSKNQRWGNTGGRSQAEVVAILNAHGHSLSA